MRLLAVKPFYNSSKDNIMTDFYIPVLSRSKIYKRVSAYFDANIISMYAKGIENIVKENGHIYFIFSNELNERDYFLIKESYDERKKYFDNLTNQLIEDKPPVELMNLAYLIKNNYVDIKIAFTKSRGIFHDKFGLCENGEDVIYFRGSNNETVASIMSNFESFETTCSWNASAPEKSKIRNAQKMFDDLWANEFSDDVIVVDMPEVMRDQLLLYSGSKLYSNEETPDNALILSYDNGVVITNKLDFKDFFSITSAFYKRAVEFQVGNIIGDNYYLKPELGYMKIKNLITELNKYADRAKFNVHLSESLLKYLENKDILIDKRRSLGISIKKQMEFVKPEFEEFEKIVNQEMERELRPAQMWDAFHMANMIRSANFSVPGAGKTSIVYGAFAYLQSIGEVDKIVMVGPINSFSSWINEFALCFGNKKDLKLFNYQVEKHTSQSQRYINFVSKARQKNLVLINYESLQMNIHGLRTLIDERTFLVFDEVHRIKSVTGIRALSGRDISVNAKYRTVLTGTPIPNGYLDIYTMLNILFTDEYDTFFGFNGGFLEQANTNYDKQIIINNAINPFFCLTTKEELQVPPASPDNLDSGYVAMNEAEKELFETLYRGFGHNILALYIRLIQASNNPKLVLKNLDKAELSLFDSQDYSPDFSNKKITPKSNLTKEDKAFIRSFDMTRKFHRGIDLVEELTNNGKVLAWGIFIDTINRIRRELKKRNVRSQVITGATPLEEREKIIEDFISGDLDVLITNPHTLGESISLHKTCHQAVYFEYSFNLVHMLQSRDRIHRLGLKEEDKTEYYYLTLDSDKTIYRPIDRKIYQRLLEKTELQKRALSSEFLTYEVDDVLEDIKMLFGGFQ